MVGVFQKADAAIAAARRGAANEAFRDWRFVEPAKRAAYLFKIAAIMRRRRFELAAWMVFEVGKTWAEADGDVAEAIDFCEFYGREMIRYAAPQPIDQVPGEKDEFIYIPLGVGAVIPPWNFPLAILAGMTVGVPGRRQHRGPQALERLPHHRGQVLRDRPARPACRPASSTSSRARAPWSARPWSQHPKTRFIAFTGSKDVGPQDQRDRGQASAPGQIWIKRVILEMGGKDSIIVDSEADLDDAAAGVVASRFRLPGPEVLGLLARDCGRGRLRRVLERLLARVEAIKVGPPTAFENYMGPVVNEAAIKPHHEIHRDRQARGPAPHGRYAARRATASSSSRR